MNVIFCRPELTMTNIEDAYILLWILIGFHRHTLLQHYIVSAIFYWYNLSKSQRTLLRTCALDFDHTAPHTAQYSLPYMKTLKHILSQTSISVNVLYINSAISYGENKVPFGIISGGR